MSIENRTYSPPEFEGDVSLTLSRNESVPAIAPAGDVVSQLTDQVLCRYPSFGPLQSAIADWLSVDSSRVVVTNGGDEGIDRYIRTHLKAGRSKVVVHSPSFEMFEIYTHNAGGQLESVEWLDGDFPVKDFVESIDENTAIAIVVSPNNPTGLCVSTDALTIIAKHCEKVGCGFLVDCAYVEFAQSDPTEQLMKLGNVTMVRTFSKAWGLAGLRVGYLLASNETEAQELRAAAGPFPVSGASLELASKAVCEFADAMDTNVQSIKQFREQVRWLVAECGGQAFDSQGNFVFAKFDDACGLWLELAKLGIAVRKFDKPGLADFLRITVPTNVSENLQLARAMMKATGNEFDLSKIVGDESLSAHPSSIKTQAGTRKSEISRKTKETEISIQLDLDGDGSHEISTGIGFLDHMLSALAFHSRMNLQLKCVGDLHIDDHHTAEDCALALGTAISEALGPRKGIKRFGYAYAPLDEGLARTVLDLSGRPWPEIHLDLKREMVGTIATENLTHFFQSLAMTLKCSLHVDVLRGDNDHHKAEAAFKSLAIALKAAISPSGNDVPSTKGVL